MRTTRGSSGSELSRAERADAAARRLALLAADIGASEPRSRSDAAPASDSDFTRVVPSRRATTHAEPAGGRMDSATEPPAVPRPGRHAARRRAAPPGRRMPDLPGLSASHVAVLALVVAAGVAFTAWWVVRGQAAPVTPPAAPAGVSTDALVDIDPGASGAAGSPGATGKVTVDVTGKVRRPGIVVLDSGARVVDALAAAGGERAGVDLGSLNLARVLVDGEQIVVGAPQPAAPPAPSGLPPSGAPVAMVNLNTATQAELETLPDVGPVTALAILTWREEHGGFTSVDELLEVDGIGEATLSTLTPYVTV